MKRHSAFKNRGLVGALVMIAIFFSSLANAGNSFLPEALNQSPAKENSVNNCLIGITNVNQTANGCEICFDPEIFLSPGSQLVSIAWDFGDGGSSTIEEPCHSYGAPGTYTVTITLNAINGTMPCSCVHTITVNVDQCCPCEIEPDFSYCVDDCEICFTNQTKADTCNVTYTWIFGDGTTSNDTNSCHTFPANGTYEVCLVVTPSTGGVNCNDTICQTICVNGCEEEPCECEIQTPNILDLGGSGCTRSITAVAPLTNNTCANLMATWDFGDGSAPITVPYFTIVSHTFPGPGPFTICVFVSGQGTKTGCEAGNRNCTTMTFNCLGGGVKREALGSGDDAINETHRLQNMDQRLKLFPNPTDEVLNLKFDEMPISGQEVEVINMNGQSVLKQRIAAQQTQLQLDVSGLPTGTYYIRLIGERGRQAFNLFVKE